MQRIIVFGECMVELFQLVENVYHQNFAGDVFNTAVYLKRMDPALKVEFLSTIGTDLVSDKLLAAVEAEKIGTSLLLRTKTARPGLYMINTDAFGERSFVYWRDSSAAKQTVALLAQKLTDNDQTLAQHLGPTDWFYFSGSSLAILPKADRMLLLQWLGDLKAQGVRIVFDPNYRPALWPDADECRAAFVAAYQLANIALPGLDDHKVLFGAGTSHDVVAQLQALGTPEIVVKNGKDGITVCYQAAAHSAQINANAPSLQFFTPAKQVKKVVDTTAAGDSFNGGYLAARFNGHAPQEAATLAAALAAFVVEHTGAIVSMQNFAEFRQAHPL